MAATYFFYDLETSGFSSSNARIMQFAGIRTDAELQPIGEPVNVLIKLTADVLPDPDAIMLTGITPQSTIIDGVTEAEFLKYFYKEVVTPDTIFLGFNTVRFDDEFMRALHYRNFYDPYEWHWQNGCSRWDILDLVRMTRALRPDGIKWPMTDEGKPTNRLELLTKANGLDHDHAHDALSDVYATIAVAKLIRTKQPDLFKYLLNCRNKKQVAELITTGQPFVYTSGRYASEGLNTTVAVQLAKHTQQDSSLVYDLRFDPRPFIAMSPEQLVEAWRYKKDRDENDPKLPVKTVKFNRCPAVAPMGVIKEPTTQERLNLSLDLINQNLALLKANHSAFASNIAKAVQLMDEQRFSEQQQGPALDSETVDSRMYDGFVAGNDKQLMSAYRAAEANELSDLGGKFSDQRLQLLAPLYKARNYPTSLSSEERQAWEEHVSRALLTGGQHSVMSKYFGRLQELATGTLTSEQEYLLEELQLYGESVMPSDVTE
jgi:exodeoxyribonuclease-1